MKVESVSLRNYCQHRELDVEFGPGVVAVVGENGSGKSNLVSSIHEAITGKFRRTKSRMVTWREKKGSVSARFAAPDGTRLEISRNLHDSDCRASVTRPSGNVEESSGTEQVASAVEEFFPYHPSVLKGVVFTPQEEITSLLFDSRSSARERMAVSFFGLDRVAEVEESVASALASIPEPAFPFRDPDHVVPTEEWVAGRESELEKARSAAAGLESELEATDARLAELEPLAREAARSIQAEQSAERAASALRQMEECRAEIRRLEESADEERCLLEGSPGSKTLAEAAGMLSDSDRHRSEAERLRTEAAEIESRISRRSELVSRIRSDVESARADLEEAVRRADLLSNSIEVSRSLSDGSEDECPSCLRAGLSDGDRARLRRHLSELEDGGALQDLEDARDALKRKVSVLTRNFESESSALAGEERDLADCVSRAESLERNVRKLVSGVRGILGRVPSAEAISRAAEAAGESEGRIREAESQISFLRSRISRLEAEVGSKAADGPAPMDRGRALELVGENSDLLSARSGRQRELMDISSRISSLELSLSEARRDIVAMRDYEERLAEYREARSFAQSVRSVFHYSAAPKKVVSARLALIGGRINSYLEKFSASFKVDAKDGFDFDCIFGRRVLGKTMSPQELSGGEKSVLSVAFRLAASETFCSSVGFVALDEPTVWVDKRRRESIPMVMSRLKDVSGESGLQSIVVTHDEDLVPHADSIVELKPQEQEWQEER